MARNFKVEKLQAGEIIVSKESGNSMFPLIKSKQLVKIAPATWDKIMVGDIVYCKCKSNYYTHIVQAIDPLKGCSITNNKGRVNGWTKNVFGKVIEIM